MEERTNNYLLVEKLDYNSPSDKKINKWRITLGGKNKKQKGIRCIYCNSSLLALNNADIRKLYRTKVDLAIASLHNLGGPHLLWPSHLLDYLPIITDPDSETMTITTKGQLILLAVQRHPIASFGVGPHVIWIAGQVGKRLGCACVDPFDPVPQ